MDKVWILTQSIYDDEKDETSVEDRSAYRSYEAAFSHAYECFSGIPPDVIEKASPWETPMIGLTTCVVTLLNGDEWSYLIEELKVY